MAIKTEFYKIREDGVRLVRTYSDINHYIQRDGVVYDEAIDPEWTERVYSELNEVIKTAEFFDLEDIKV